MQALLVSAMVLLLAAGDTLAASWDTSSFRTPNGQLVTRGMSMSEVLRDAGEPVNRVKVSEGVSIDGKVGESVELWTYRGSDGLYDVTFQGTQVTKISVTPKR
jgi:hypothetical protein